MYQPFDDIYDLLVSAGLEKKTLWFIITDVGSETLYLKEIDSKRPHVVRWIRDYRSAQVFITEVSAKEYIRRYLCNRHVLSIKHEVD